MNEKVEESSVVVFWIGVGKDLGCEETWLWINPKTTHHSNGRPGPSYESGLLWILQDSGGQGCHNGSASIVEGEPGGSKWRKRSFDNFDKQVYQNDVENENKDNKQCFLTNRSESWIFVDSSTILLPRLPLEKKEQKRNEKSWKEKGKIGALPISIVDTRNTWAANQVGREKRRLPQNIQSKVNWHSKKYITTTTKYNMYHMWKDVHNSKPAATPSSL